MLILLKSIGEMETILSFLFLFFFFILFSLLIFIYFTFYFLNTKNILYWGIAN